jgi:hypothetical protein
MNFLIAGPYTDRLARLSGDEQNAVKTTAFDLQLNPVPAVRRLHAGAEPAPELLDGFGVAGARRRGLRRPRAAGQPIDDGSSMPPGRTLAGRGCRCNASRVRPA